MKNPGSASESALKKIEREFSKYRRGRSGKKIHIPSNLKALALSAIDAGATNVGVAESAGVSAGAIHNWKKARTSLKSALRPRELKLLNADFVNEIPAAQTPAHHLLAEGHVARIRLHSGVSVEVPVAAIAGDLLIALNQLGVGPC